MATSDFDLSKPNVFKTDVSFNVKYDEVGGVKKKNPRIENPNFTLGGIEFRLGANIDWDEIYMVARKHSLWSLDDCWEIDCQVAKDHTVTLQSGSRLAKVASLSSHDQTFDLTITMVFKNTQLYRLPFVDAETANKIRADCKIILNDDTTKPIYVNKTLLAMHSPFFNKLFFGDFQEKDQEEAKLSDVTEVDFLQYLFCVQPPCKPFTFKNLEAPLRLADYFQNEVLLLSIENFLYKNTKTSEEKRQTLVWAGRYQMKAIFYKTLEQMENADFKSLDFKAAAQCKEPYMEALLKRMSAL